MVMWDKMNRMYEPNEEIISQFVGNPVWDELNHYITTTYQTKPTFEYSGCAWPGWNVKFKKAGKNLCTIYPFEGYLWVLVVIGNKEKVEFEAQLSSMSSYIKDLYKETSEGMGQHWLKIEIEDADRIDDIKRCIAIKRGVKKKQVTRE